MTSSSGPSSAMSRIFSSLEVSSLGTRAGSITVSGCLSKVTTALVRPRSRAISMARPMTARWPACTPSNVPSASARGRAARPEMSATTSITA